MNSSNLVSCRRQGFFPIKHGSLLGAIIVEKFICEWYNLNVKKAVNRDWNQGGRLMGLEKVYEKH